MNKTILTIMALSTVAMAGTTGNVEVYGGTAHQISYQNNSQNGQSNKIIQYFAFPKLGVKTEIKVKDTGLSLGARVEKNFLTMPITDFKNAIPDNNEIYLKYDLPEMNKVNSFVKLGAEIIDTHIIQNYKGAILEGDVSFKVKDNLRLGYNVDTRLPFDGNIKIQKNNGSQPAGNYEYRDIANTKHKIYLTDEKNVNIFGELVHTYAKGNNVISVGAGLNANKKINDVELSADVDFKYLISDNTVPRYKKHKYLAGTKINDIMGYLYGANANRTFFSADDYHHSYDLKLKYKGFDANIFVQHIGNRTKKDNLVDYGLGLGIEHKLKNTKLTVVGKGLVVGSYAGFHETTGQKQLKEDHLFDTYIKGGLKYDLVETSKFRLTPTIYVVGNFSNGQEGLKHNDNKVHTNVYITPELEMKYIPTNNFEIKGAVVAQNIFDKDMKHIQSLIQSKLNIKYTW